MVDQLTCCRYGSPRFDVSVQILAVITKPEEIHKVLRHLLKVGRSPPVFDRFLLLKLSTVVKACRLAVVAFYDGKNDATDLREQPAVVAEVRSQELGDRPNKLPVG